MQPADALRPDDLEVIGAALSHFAGGEEFEPLPSLRGGRWLVVHRRTAGGSAFVRGEQVRADADGARLPDDALADLEARNNGPPVTVSSMTFTSVRREGADLRGLSPDGADVVADDLTRFESGDRFGFDRAFRKAHPEAKAYARAWLPGYTADASRAVVRLSFGPTAHGATATYLLEKEAAGKWKVTWRKHSYYA